MNAATDEIYQRLRKQLDDALNADKRLANIAEKIKQKQATLADTAEYSEIVANHITAVLQAAVGDIRSPLGKEMVCRELLRDHYAAINDVLGTVQAIVDEQREIHIRPQQAAFPAERVQKVAHALEDPTVPLETIRRRANAPVANVAKSFHDDYIKENAKFRADAGLKCWIVRTTDGKCCKWCTQVAGRYEYGTEPEDVYRRHDNCGCTTIYENGRQRQDVWSKKKWEVPAADAGAKKPTILTPAQGRALQAKHRPTVLTRGSRGGIIKNIELPPETDTIRSMSAETKQLVMDAFDKISREYDVRIDQIVAMPLQSHEKTVPFQFQPIRGKYGELIKRIVINTDYDFMGNQEAFQARIMRNFTKGVLSSNCVEGLIAHEMAHVMTFQDVASYTGYMGQNKIVEKRIVYGISGYADAKEDGAECIAEAFAALRCKQIIPQEAVTLVNEYIERWRKNNE